MPPCRTAITRNVPAVLPAVYKPPAVIDPPVSEYVTDTAEVLPSLIRPTVVNCCVAPVVRDTLAGVSSTAVNVGAGTVIVTLEVSALVPPCCVAMTRNVPASGAGGVQAATRDRAAGGGPVDAHAGGAAITHAADRGELL